MTVHLCENCGNQFEEEYCNRCGQKIAHRITMPHIFHDVTHAFTHADKGFFFLMMELFRRPGIVAREYIVERKRKKYFNPFQYIIILGSIAVFVAANSHFMQTTVEAMGTTGSSERQMQFVHRVTELQTKYYNFLILLQLPFLALGSFLLYKKKKFNFAEHLTLQTFITAQNTLLGMLMMIGIAITGRKGMYISLGVGVFTFIYQIIAFTQFFEGKVFRNFLRALVAYFLGFIFFAVFMGVIMVLVIVMFYSK